MQTYLLSRKYFKLAFIIYAFINTLALGYLGFNLNILLFIMIGWGGLIIGWDFYQKQINYHDIKFILIITYGLILFLATAINPYSNLKSYLIALLQLMIFFFNLRESKKFFIKQYLRWIKKYYSSDQPINRSSWNLFFNNVFI